MATHSSILAWRIPWTEEPGGLQSMESRRVSHDRETNTTTIGLTGRKQVVWESGGHPNHPRHWDSLPWIHTMS